MKAQDFFLLALLLVLLFIRKPKLITSAALFFILIAIPLFAKHIFFTAERLVWYSVLFLWIAVIWELGRMYKKS